MNISQTLDTIMTEQTICVAPTDSYKAIEQIFQEHNFHHIPVVNSAMNVLGIISKHDMGKVVRRLSMETTGETYSKFALKALTAVDFMTPQPLHLSSKDSVAIAAKIILKNRYHAIPIIENEKLVGIITNHDLLKYAYDISYELDRTK